VSVHVLTAVWKASKARGGSLIVLLAIADYADHNGVAFPAVSTLAKKARMTERNVQFALKELVKLEELSITRGTGPHGVNVYRVKCFLGEKSSGVKNTTGEGEAHFTQSVIRIRR